MSDPIRTADQAHGVRALMLDRPPANALDDALLAALEDALDDAAADDAVRALVIRAHGAFFCGGFDLRAPRRTGDQVTAMVERYRDSHRKLLAFPKPTIAAVQGHAIAGGLVLALACDHRIAMAGDYRVGLNETVIGAAFPPVALEIVRLRLTHGAASELLLGAELYPASELVRLGVVPHLTAPADFDERVRVTAQRLAGLPREVYAHGKAELLRDAVRRLDAVSLERELAIAALWSTPESRAARAAQRQRLG